MHCLDHCIDVLDDSRAWACDQSINSYFFFAASDSRCLFEGFGARCDVRRGPLAFSAAAAAAAFATFAAALLRRATTPAHSMTNSMRDSQGALFLLLSYNATRFAWPGIGQNRALSSSVSCSFSMYWYILSLRVSIAARCEQAD